MSILITNKHHQNQKNREKDTSILGSLKHPVHLGKEAFFTGLCEFNFFRYVKNLTQNLFLLLINAP